ncbi:(2Fe-2S) ferredoxin domain-containing protein [Streptoalloteichus tenebrarius]|uniref:(2Fe-2S) ferredoxin domain-containing protein n=1 Tax=Streptoalloteichus tenebrarius (strain ATCC 17920 / DSM 40477 / JCM 4838 / CBS 697.72 / NBRC 16177 / NCIMB 11028 / NRRL B-12390 / A12253. 1 / ISP 5477) TaxID=1933 RepID=UPI0020A5B51C|nr:(2Fe-2S) ferredoxin domain-containing protein [Streptoalloteichus tenebrarius]
MSEKPVRVTVCRGCCCGTRRKHPGVDHDWQLQRLRALAASAATRVEVRTSDCLDACEHSNLVVVHASGAKPVWLGFVLDETVLDDLEGWLAAGGPGRAPLPDALELHRVTPPARRVWAQRRQWTDDQHV